MFDQKAKYLVFQKSSESDAIDVYPAEDWYFFTKDTDYATYSCDQAEELFKNKEKVKSNHIDSLITSKAKDECSKGSKNIIVEEKDDEDKAFFSGHTGGGKKEKEVQEEKELRDESNLSMEEDEEENSLEDIIDRVEDKIDEESSSGSVGFLDGDVDSEASNDLDLSQIDEEEKADKESKTKDNDILLNKKRNAETNLDPKEKNKKTIEIGFEKIASGVLKKHAKISMSNLMKELKSAGLPQSMIQSKINGFLSGYCQSFIEKKEEYYILK